MRTLIQDSPVTEALKAGEDGTDKVRLSRGRPRTNNGRLRIWNKPCADPGLVSYRYWGRYGWIMIGARDNADALREAKRSTDNVDPSRLHVWNGTEYVPAQ